ncbi:MAG TPA: VOC family protein [Flavobacteriales bacterium]|nr:VOC family protein [Flavobacteriales bacterium]HRN37818.1 VOC family protein [Flavobacteriales bacterium]HRO39075.1 VOC family protein [Flavobacteriales bacterium]HRP81340.1 VOC family protein [Flavobacteriales bacterium]HRQ85917.1 VOC family protein [Flavobacteriales bacterium]
MLNGRFHLAFATTDLKRIKAFYGGLLGCPEGRSSDTWVDYDFFGHQLTVQQVPMVTRTARTYNPESHIPSDHWGIVLDLADWRKLRDRFKKVGVPFFIEPQLVMKGQPGEQHSLFIEDPDGHAIEFKAFESPDSLFRKG